MRNKIIMALIIGTMPFLLQAQDSVPEVSKLLGLSLEELMNIRVVTATGSSQTITEAPSTMNVITADQIRERGYEQLEDALRDVPGIDMIHVNGYVPTLIYFRGMYGAENLRALLMINGIPENNIIGSNDMAGPAYSLHHVERIEIIWGPASALYGANAFGGVINIITKTGEKTNGFSYEKGFGSFNTSVDKVMFGIRKSNIDLSISGSLYSTDGPKFKNRDPNYTASYVDKAYSLHAALSYILPRSKTSFVTRIYNTPMGWGTFLNSPTVFFGLPPQGNLNTGVIGLVARDVRGERSGLEEPYYRTFYLQEDLNPNNRLNIMARVSYRETGISERSYAYITIDGSKLYRVPTCNYSNRLGGEISANYNYKHFQFSGGLQYFQENIEEGNRKINIDSTTIFLLDGRDTLLNLYSSFKEREFDVRNNFGSYLQFIWHTKLLRKTNFTVGARYDHNNYYGSPVSPRFAMVSQPSDRFTFKVLVGTSYRAPTNTEIYQAPPDTKLLVERVTTYELNLIYKLSGSILLQANGFRNEMNDVIAYANLGTATTDKNPARVWITGAEAKADIAFSNSLSCFANFTFQDARGRNNVTGFSGKISGVAELKGNLGFTYKYENLFTTNLTGNWVGSRRTPRTNPYGPVDGYFLTNLTVSTEKFFNKRIHASISVHNLFDVKYLDPGIRTGDGYIYPTVLEQQGINCMFKVGLSL